MTKSAGSEEYEEANRHFASRRYQEALAIYRRLADLGDPQAEVHVGWMYYTGRGLLPDVEEARRWYLRAAESGSPMGQFYLARLAASQGKSEEALSWFERAAEQEYGPALFRLGLAYEQGKGTSVDREKASRLFERAASKGNLHAQRRLLGPLLRGERGIVGRIRGVVCVVGLTFRSLRIELRDPGNEKVLA
jgi:TPR repeat protein